MAGHLFQKFYLIFDIKNTYLIFDFALHLIFDIKNTYLIFDFALYLIFDIQYFVI